MGSLAVDTAVEALEPGRYRATLCPDWNLVGPNGGYLAAIALRVAQAAAPEHRPTSISCQFLAPAKFGAVELTATPLRATGQTSAVRVRISQEPDQHILEALVWSASADLTCVERCWQPMPDAPGPEELVDLKPALVAGGGWVPPWHDSVNLRLVSEDPPALTWARFRPVAAFDDLWLDACRSLVLLDSLLWPALRQEMPRPDRTLALTLHLSASFHGFAPDAEWLLVEASGYASGLGFAGGRTCVWASNGRLMASGSQQMLLHEMVRGNRLAR